MALHVCIGKRYKDRQRRTKQKQRVVRIPGRNLAAMENHHTSWNVLIISEVRRTRENQVTLKSENVLYYKGEDTLIRESEHLVKNILDAGSISSKAAYLIVKLNKKYNIRIVKAYAPISMSAEEELEDFYEDIVTVTEYSTAYFTLLIGDFNSKLGHKKSEEETAVGEHGYE